MSGCRERNDSPNIEIKDDNTLTREDFVFLPNREKLYDQKFEGKPVGFFKDALLRLQKNKASVVAFVLILIIAFFALFGPFMSPYGYNDQDVKRVNMPPRIPVLENLGIADGSRVLYNNRKTSLSDPEKFPEGSVLEIVNEYQIRGVDMVDVKVNYYTYSGYEDSYFVMGTDYLGRDLWVRLWRGARVSLMIAVLSVFVNICIGIVYGAIAGYYGGRVDIIMMRFTEIIGAFPQVIVATLLILFLGTRIQAIVLALIIRGWIGTAQLIRSQFLRFKGREYVLAAKVMGVTDKKVIFRHILPNSIGPIITRAMVEVPGAIFAESFLAFIGLGLQAPEPSIGVLLSDAQKVLNSYPYQTLFPAILISVLMISFNLFGNGLRDAFNPAMRGSSE